MNRTRTLPARKNANSPAVVSPARLAAFKILARVEDGSAFASVLLATQADQLQPSDRSLCHELVLGALRRQLWLDGLIEHYATRDPQSLDSGVRLALRLGLYQMRFLARIPDSAAVNESVNLVRLARLRSAGPFVNAVLRRAAREPEYDPAAGISDPLARLAVASSHPAWLIERWVKQMGLAAATAFATANNEIPPVAFRIVNQRKNQSQVLADLEASGAVIVPSLISPDAWRVTGATARLQELAREGRIYVQDESSQLVAHVLDVQPGERVLDVCAAPGSKATHIADFSHGKSILVAGDLHLKRLRTVVASGATQHLDYIRCVALDALQPLPFPEATFDRVLVDAPCTGTGTLRRNPEIRWRISRTDIDDLAGRQLRILLNAARVLKPCGRLLYSTCSVEPEENEQVIVNFLDHTAGFERLRLSVKDPLPGEYGAVRIWPHRDGGDGFFMAALRRNPS
jgi:16S rRNA (cytosine967-C5)-methyltransferase